MSDAGRTAAVAERVLAVIAADRTGAFTQVDPNLPRRAAELDAVPAERRGPLHGLPVAVKDLVDVAGLETDWGSAAYRSVVAGRDAPVVARLRAAGALIVGKTRTAPLAASVVTPGTSNPLDERWISGGSSGGSAAAVGIGAVVAAVGTDTAGSIRMPAAMCGVVGYKPTFGLIPTDGVLPASATFDTVGPLADSVARARSLALVMADGLPGAPGSGADSRLGLLGGALFTTIDPAVQAPFEDALEHIARSGQACLPFEVPHEDFVGPALLAVDAAEVAEIHREAYHTRAAAMEPDPRAFILAGSTISAATYRRALRVRSEIRTALIERMQTARIDILVGPASPAVPLSWSDLGRSWTTPDGMVEGVGMAFSRVCWLASLTGCPAITVPILGLSVPCGIQLIGRPGTDLDLLDYAAHLEALLAS